MLLRIAPLTFAVLWSTGYIGAKLGAPYAEPFTFLSLRFGLVLIVLVPAFMLMRLQWPRGRDFWHAILAGALMHGVYLGGIFWAIAKGMPTGISALIISLQPLLTSVLAWPLLGERLTWRQWGGFLIGLAGVVLVLLPRLESGMATVPPETLPAALIGLASITAGTLYQKRLAAMADVRTGFAVQFVGALAVTVAMAYAFERREVIWTGQFVLALGWLVVVLSIGAMALLTLMLRSNAVARVAALFYLIPAITAVMAHALFGETLTVLQLVGMAVVTGAVVLARGGSSQA